jgi:hypothetical protein
MPWRDGWRFRFAALIDVFGLDMADLSGFYASQAFPAT